MAVEKNCESDVATLLLGNKCDLTDERVISKEQAQALAEENNMIYFETSAREGKGVQEAFEHMIDSVYKKKFAMGPDAMGARPEHREGTIKLGRQSEKAAAEKEKKKGGCCK